MLLGRGVYDADLLAGGRFVLSDVDAPYLPAVMKNLAQEQVVHDIEYRVARRIPVGESEEL